MSSIREEVSYHRGVDIRNSDVFNLSCINQLLHCLPSISLRYWIWDHDWFGSSWVKGNSWWVSFLEWNELGWSWPVNQIKIEVFQLEIVKGSLTSSWNILRSHICHPQLGCNEQFSSGNDSFVDGSLDTLSCLFLISVTCGLVNASIASLDSSVNLIGSFVFGDLPASESNRWHLLSRRQCVMS